ncbi:unnamed protein product [Phytomonas sp. EM1]|nr:unnamed protein product [Phytomonas sp. EM1]|eukprot:CCW61091.1 unnamed protein product [Phytomonas sp. isolate EM1]
MNFFDLEKKKIIAEAQPDTTREPPSFSQVMAARKAIDSYIYETPLIASISLSKQTGHHKILLKCENLQRTGSYHYRGFIYKVIRTKEKDLLVNNFITYSVANAGPALACASEDFQSTARVVIPKNTHPPIKSSIRHYGGEVYNCAPTLESRNGKLLELLKRFNQSEGNVRNRAVVVDPYNDDDIIAGYATIGIEMMLQTDCEVDCIVAPVGGGALINGIAIAVRGMKPNVAVFGAVSDFSSDDNKSLRYGSIAPAAEGAASDSSTKTGEPFLVAEGSPVEGQITQRNYEYMKKLVNGVLRVTEQDIRYAFRYVYERCKLVIDLKAATAVAAVLAKPRELRRFQCVAVVLSGGNVDLMRVPKIVSSAL